MGLTDNEILVSDHSRERIAERGIKIDMSLLTESYIKSLPYYTDRGCYKFLDAKNQVVYYIRNFKNKLQLETIVKTNPIQMLRNLCDAFVMRCRTHYHNKNQCVYCNKWDFKRICRDHIFGTCKRKNCKYNHVNVFGSSYLQET